MSLRKMLIATLMMPASVASHAVPNIWVSGFGQGLVSAFASVDELNPAARETAASDVPFLRKPAMMSAVCQSFCIDPSTIADSECFKAEE